MAGTEPREARLSPDHREARLRPEFAARYPGCPAGQWLPASTAAAYVLARREVLLGPIEARARRALDPGAWEFSGENRFGNPPRTSRRRFNDRQPSGGYAALTSNAPAGVGHPDGAE